MRYFEEASRLWNAYVPPRGRADTVQGELVRAIEKLRDEAQRNGNVNWNLHHAELADFVRETLVNSGSFDRSAQVEIVADIATLLNADYPETSDEPYDRLLDRVVEWSRDHPEPIPFIPERPDSSSRDSLGGSW